MMPEPIEETRPVIYRRVKNIKAALRSQMIFKSKKIKEGVFILEIVAGTETGRLESGARDVPRSKFRDAVYGVE